MPLTIDPDNVTASETLMAEAAYSDQNINAGEIVAIDPATGHAYTPSASQSHAGRDLGIAVGSCKSDQWCPYIDSGEVNLQAAVLQPGEVYVLSTTAGKICRHADLPAGAYVCVVGVAKTTTTLTLGFIPTASQKS